MDMDARTKQFTALRSELSITYVLVTGILARLPIPMLLPERQGDDPVWAINAMARAWDLADWEPLPKLVTGRIRDMITAWLTAYELAVCVQDDGPVIWRLRGMEAALNRVRVCARYIEQRLANGWNPG